MNRDEQFVDDYLVVVENDSYAWELHRSIVVEEAYNVHDVGSALQDLFETNVSVLLNKLDPSHNHYTTNIMREMLLGWGVSPYEKIAKQLIERIREG